MSSSHACTCIDQTYLQKFQSKISCFSMIPDSPATKDIQVLQMHTQSTKLVVLKQLAWAPAMHAPYISNLLFMAKVKLILQMFQLNGKVKLPDL